MKNFIIRNFKMRNFILFGLVVYVLVFKFFNNDPTYFIEILIFETVIYVIIFITNKKIRNSYEHKINLIGLFYFLFLIIHSNVLMKDINYLNLF